MIRDKRFLLIAVVGGGPGSVAHSNEGDLFPFVVSYRDHKTVWYEAVLR